MIANRVMQCRVEEKVKVRKQEIIEEIKYFRYWEVSYLKWKCPNIEVEKKKRKEEEVVYIARPQKAQQKRRLVYSVWKKIQKYCGEESIPPKVS